MGDTESAFKRLRELKTQPPQPTADFTRDYQAEKEKEKLASRKQNRGLRRCFGWIIIGTLWVELLFLGALILMQGFGLNGFKLNQWVFGFFVNGALLQTFFLVRVVLNNLFPAPTGK